MANYNYTTGIPATNNDPSVDQPPMRINTNSIHDIIAEDHFGFNNNQGGMHQKCRFYNAGAAAAPSGTAANVATLYSNFVATSGATNESELFLTPDLTGNFYQLTRTINTAYAQFGTNAAYGAPPGGFTQIGGWTFLPGGLLLQYGTFTGAFAGNTPTTIQFPTAFSTAVYTVLIMIVDALTGTVTYRVVGVPGLTSFQVRISSAITTGVYWNAIGV